ncbi:MAG: ABC transporter permease [Verrucomicrobiota bacterium]
MGTFIFRRFLSLIPLLLGVTFFVFLLMELAPGDFLTPIRAQKDIKPETIAQMEKEFGLNDPWYIRYGLWLKNASQFNFGYSWSYKMPVVDLIMERVPATLTLSLTSLFFAWVIAIPLGVLAAIHKDSWIDRLTGIFAYAALSVPEFFLALLALFFAAQTGWFPLGGITSTEYDFLSWHEKVFDFLHHLILPMVVLGLGGIAGTMRLLRANLLDFLRAEFVTTARAKGLPEGTILFRHVLRNAINPFLSSMGSVIAGLLGGSLLVENVLNYPGLGQLLYEALLREDQFLVMASVLMGCIFLVVGNLISDFLLAWSDPRIRLG